MPVLELSRVLQEGDRELKRTLTFADVFLLIYLELFSFPLPFFCAGALHVFMIKALGWILLVASTGSLVLFLYAAVFIRLLPAPSKSESPVLHAIRDDQYYHLLIPVTVPVAVVAVYLNWFSINLFKSS